MFGIDIDNFKSINDTHGMMLVFDDLPALGIAGALPCGTLLTIRSAAKAVMNYIVFAQRAGRPA
jgi:hypothetical protein